MINVKVVYWQKNCKEISVYGHADSGLYGQDLVCAAVSGIVFGTLNALEQSFSENIKIDIEDNKIKITVIKSIKETNLMLKMLVIQLKTVTNQYPNNITLKEVDLNEI